MTARVSVIMPVYNEVKTVGEIIARVRAALSGHPWELIVVDDGSTDGTRDVLKKLAAEGPDEVQVVSHEVNAGKGAAIRTGLGRARGEIILIQDADL